MQNSHINSKTGLGVLLYTQSFQKSKLAILQQPLLFIEWTYSGHITMVFYLYLIFNA